MTVHINAQLQDVAKFVLMPGDPLRAKVMAHKFLDSPKLINSVRGMLMYTGTYKGVFITIAASGMGNGSMGIYSYELFHDYQVEVIVRVGTAGAYKRELGLYSLFLATESFGESDFAKIMIGNKNHIVEANQDLAKAIEGTAQLLNLKLAKGRAHSSEVFYRPEASRLKLAQLHHLDVVEMETFSLFSNAQALNKRAGALFTISDNLITQEVTSSEERQNKMDQMFRLALETGYQYLKK